ncbi:MAG: helix-turn-helix domain-containing protein [Rhodothermales bacterium]
MESLLSNDWLSTIHVLGAAQGIFLAFILASKRRNWIANKILAVAMLAFSLELVTAVYHARGYDDLYPHFIGATYPLPLLFAPLLYLYAKTVSAGSQSFKKGNLFHFIPIVLVVLYLVPFYLQSGPQKLALLKTPDQHPWTPELTAINHFKFVYSFVYLILIIRLLKRHRERVQNAFSSIEHINLAWLRNMTVGGVTLWSIALIFYVLGLVKAGRGEGLDPIEGYDDYVALGMAVFVYTIGYLGLRQPEIFEPRAHPYQPEMEMPPVSGTGGGFSSERALLSNEAYREKPRYAKSGMDPETAQTYLQRLIDLMEQEKPYTNSTLTLQDLADALSISAHNLSEIINTQLGQNFYDFVNSYRVREVQRRMADPHYAHFTLLAIGQEAGFNAKSSFNAVFKKHTKMTPSHYKKHLLQDAEA